MHSEVNSGKLLSVRDGWLLCPVCGKTKVLRIYPETRGRMIQVFCKRCGSESIVNIEQCQCHECQCR